jgi:hypothetical protein
MDGQPVASRILRAGGLDGLTALLAADPTRVDAGLRKRDADPIAAAETTRWLNTLAAETATTLADWSRQGLRAAATVFVHGPGSHAVDLPAALADVGLTTRIDDVLAHLPGAPSERPSAVSGYLAAATLGASMPYAAFVDPYAAAELARRAARTRTRRTIATSLAATAMILAATAGPAGYASVITRQAETARAAAGAARHASTTRDQASELVAVTEARTTLAGPARTAAQIAAATLSETPAGVQVDDIDATAQPGSPLEQVTATAHVPTLPILSRWVRAVRTALTKTDPGTQVTVSQVTRDPARPGAGLQVTLRVRPSQAGPTQPPQEATR